MNTTKKKLLGGFVGIAAIGLLAGCTNYATTSLQHDSNYTNNQLQTYQANQPAPYSVFSEYRQTLIDVESAQIHGVATTTFFMNMGVPDPYETCPSVGFPVASTSQLTNPEQVAFAVTPGSGNNGYDSGVVSQAEPNGSYTGSSSGTYVECVAPNGTKYANYWEGNVHTVGGPAHWDKTTHSIVLDGQPTVVAGSGSKKK